MVATLPMFDAVARPAGRAADDAARAGDLDQDRREHQADRVVDEERREGAADEHHRDEQRVGSCTRVATVRTIAAKNRAIRRWAMITIIPNSSISVRKSMC